MPTSSSDNSSERYSALLMHLDTTCSEHISGGRRPSTAVQAPQGSRDSNALGRWTEISSGFYQINIAFNFIVGGNNNSISNQQGNNIDAINFKVLGMA